MKGKNIIIISCAECGLLIPRDSSRCFTSEFATICYCGDCYKKIRKQTDIWVYVAVAFFILLSAIVFIYF